MKKLLVFLWLVLLVSAVHAAAAFSFELVEPEPFQQFMIGDAINVRVETVDGEFSRLHFMLTCIGDDMGTTAGSVIIPETGVKVYESSVSTAGKAGGTCNLSVVAESHPQEGVQGIWVTAESVPVYLNPELAPESPAVVVRNMPSVFYPGGKLSVGIAVYPNLEIQANPATQFTGIIITEQIPEGFEYHSMTSNMFGVQPKYDSEKNELKLVLKGNPVEWASVSYELSASEGIEPETELGFSGEWELLVGGTEGELVVGGVTGKIKTKAAGFSMPECPITNLQLLEYIDQWTKMELSLSEAENDDIMQQIIEVWLNCP